MAKALAELLEEGVAGRHVLVRSDLNVPLKDGVVTDDGRVRASLPVIEKLAKAGARVIVTAHLGRPKGQVDPQYSIAPAAARLAELASVPVQVATDLVGEDAKAKSAALKDGEVLVLENVRYDARETSKDDAERGAFADELVALTGQNGAYVDDAFGAVHRKHASVYDVAKRLPAYLGDLVKKEVDVLAKTLNNPERPFVVVMGGAKVSDKLAVIDNLIGKADAILIGGGMGYTFAYAQGYKVGKSLLEKDQVETVRRYLETAPAQGTEIITAVDVVWADDFSADAKTEIRPIEDLEGGELGAEGEGLDIGPKSRELFAEKIKAAKTVFWNGPVGVFEIAPFAGGTEAVAKALAESDAFSIIGGGDSASAIRNLGFADEQFGHISTGGGASLEYIEGKTLPGLDALGA
ncbi:MULTISPECIES: phosphoglycerate kinase [Rothia]|jgi:phosphoglycerate kinase|uniref:Phosphoglycerate kinase n=1 Tax=Rothia aeria F0474 TaxID=1125724 RepID=I0UVM3_9MICC|nr:MULTISPECIES: phosphoglycerate kinase [Rothia]EID51926.1 phosphoglycerate kinase [Rothia aeria F0474]KGI99746.1 phosphoglycerate kinase [Rothia aeria]KGJ34547.1 phosphoglycerate kinase [Rothia aeria]QXW93290.1 phosphoglycerate kinase [Rothia aeria]RUP73594.1 phosphoglycerate kinase [Rothia sp. HSID18069]